jgi:hypothetical protein
LFDKVDDDVRLPTAIILVHGWFGLLGGFRFRHGFPLVGARDLCGCMMRRKMLQGQDGGASLADRARGLAGLVNHCRICVGQDQL